ncbi:MAG: hypothetical protein IPL61_24595 [Myxococcales bacterium]|nr:hypothetical protein [Myxococcales bacterium]
MTARILATLVVVAALGAGGCDWFDDGPPTRACKNDRDCFAAQGEYCDQPTLTCVQRDAGAVTAVEAP